MSFVLSIWTGSSGFAVFCSRTVLVFAFAIVAVVDMRVVIILSTASYAFSLSPWNGAKFDFFKAVSKLVSF